MTVVPTDASGLTPAWLSGVLGVDVVGVDILDQAFATNQRLRIALRFGAPAGAPDSLFVKLAPLDPAHRAMIGATGMGEREALFYSDLAGRVDLRVPRSYWAATAADGGFVLLLEDLQAGGCAFSDGAWGVDADTAAAALEDLARFHARFADPSVRAAVAPGLSARRSSGAAATAQLLSHVLDENRDVLTPAYTVVGELYVTHHEHLDTVWNQGPQTLIHGDPHIGNVFLDGSRLGFLDWGLCRVSTPLRDVSYFLTMSVDPDERRGAERDLLRLYLDALRSSSGIEIPFEEAWFGHRVQAGYTVVATFLAFMPSYLAGDGQALGAALRARSEMALEDLDTVEAVRAVIA